MTNHADNLDASSELEEDFRAAAIKAACVPEPVPSDFDGKHCFECDVEIPKPRLELGKFRCIDCQSVRERNQKLFRSL